MRRLPTPGIFLMHGDLAQLKPTWGECGLWRWFTWASLNPAQNRYDWTAVDAYLDKAAGRPVALSVMLYPDINQDCTPAWVGAGWPIKDGAYAGGTFPRWNDWAWDAALKEMIGQFGARYDADPRVAAVWICTARYGETVTDGLGSDTHNPGRFFSNMLNWYAAAFPTKPLMILNTGPTDRLALSRQAWELGICAKFNALNRDVRTHVMVRPAPGGGHAEIAQEALARGMGQGWEHYYAETPNETYWAILTMLALGGTVLDLPAKHLDALAAIPGLWDLALDVMETPLDRAGLFVARDTALPTGDWEHGYIGPWKRRIATNATCYAPGSAGYKAAPATLTGTIEGHGGIGWCSNRLDITTTLPDGEYEWEIVCSPANGDNWVTRYMVTTISGTPNMFTPVDDPCWLHRVVALPYEAEPWEPDDEDKPDPDLTAIRRDIETLTALTSSLDMAQDAQAERLAELDAALVRLEARILALEDSKAAALEALGQLREALV